MFTMKQNYAGFWIPKLIAEFEVFGWNITKVYSGLNCNPLSRCRDSLSEEEEDDDDDDDDKKIQ